MYACNIKQKEETKTAVDLLRSKKNDTVYFNDLLLEIRKKGLQISYLSKDNQTIKYFNPKDTFKIRIKYNSQIIEDTNYRFKIRPFSKGFKLLKSLSKNTFLATINNLDKEESKYEIFIESNHILFKLKSRQGSKYTYLNGTNICLITLKLHMPQAAARLRARGLGTPYTKANLKPAITILRMQILLSPKKNSNP